MASARRKTSTSRSSRPQPVTSPLRKSVVRRRPDHAGTRRDVRPRRPQRRRQAHGRRTRRVLRSAQRGRRVPADRHGSRTAGGISSTSSTPTPTVASTLTNSRAPAKTLPDELARDKPLEPRRGAGVVPVGRWVGGRWVKSFGPVPLRRGREAEAARRRLPHAGPKWFLAMDKNGDGFVSPQEFVGARRIFAKFDTNKDGRISAEEAEAAKRVMGSHSPPRRIPPQKCDVPRNPDADEFECEFHFG